MNTLLMEDYSFTYEALNTIYDSLESDTNNFKCLITTGFLMESGASNDIIMESVTDIFKTIADGIKKFIDNIKRFFKKILLYITSSYQDLDKVAKQVKEIIKDKTDISFNIDGYKFTVINKNGPNVSEFQKIVSNYNDDMTDISNLKETEIKNDIHDWLQESNLDKLRGQVLGINQSIPEDEYLEEIRKYYRNGENETKSIIITNSEVNSIISNAKKLEETKKASINDRDKLIDLLSKTETFFRRNIQIVYKGNNKQINVNKINIDDNKFSKEDNKVNVTDETTRVISIYASNKAKQVNKIASMINLVACEKVNALKDQIKQERNILRKCLFGNTKDESKDNLTESTKLDGKDYSLVAMESAITTYPVYEEVTRKSLFEETNFILESLLSGEISKVLEADTNKLGGKIKQTITDIIEMVINNFRKKAIGTDDFNKAWIEDITKSENKLEEKAKSKKEFTMVDFFSADYKKMANNLRGSITAAYKNGKYDDISWASTIDSSINSAEIVRDTDTRTRVLNYYRTGKFDDKFGTITMSGNELSSKIKTMTDYILNYAGSVTKPAEDIYKTFKSASDGFKIMESWTPSTHLEILGCSVSESDVLLCRDYDLIFGMMEASNDTKNGNNNALSGDINKSVKNAANAASNETKTGEKIKSATTVTSTEDETKAKGLNINKTNGVATSYKKMVDRFFSNCITSYIKAREEQYIAFSNALADIDGTKPKKDKNGKYIPKNTTDKKTEESKDVVKTNSK